MLSLLTPSIAEISMSVLIHISLDECLTEVILYSLIMMKLTEFIGNEDLLFSWHCVPLLKTSRGSPSCGLGCSSVDKSAYLRY